MALNKQIHLYSVATDAFYTEAEQYRHKRLLKLYKARQKKDIQPWRKKAINSILEDDDE